MNETVKKRFKEVLPAIGLFILVALFFLAAIATQIRSFEVYKKKHGNHMTYWDYMIDSERKH